MPEQVLEKLNRTHTELSDDLKLYAALMLYQQGKFSSNLASEMAGIPRVQFLELCEKYDISILHKPFVVRTFDLGTDVQIDREEMYIEKGI